MNSNDSASQKPSEEILSVTQITHAVKEILEANFPLLAVQGEISNFRRQSSGHLYFSLKDAKCQISAVMFRGNVSQLAKMPQDGDQVIVRGNLNVYEPRGSYQLVIRSMEAVGLGDLLLQLDRLKREIKRRGWFDEGKQPLPPFPQRIGVVTSPTGAAIRDMLHVLNRRYAGFQLLLNPVRVQGKEAAAEIAQAIQQFNQYNLADVLIIGRGGGSIEDLWPFNEEIVARAIWESRIPTLCAVGHETDNCIAEYVADVRAPTPSAAAELVVAERAALEQHLVRSRRRLDQTLQHQIAATRHRLDRFRAHPSFATPSTLLEPWMQRVDDLAHSLDSAVRFQLRQSAVRLGGLRRQAGAMAPTAQIANYRKRLLSLRHGMEAALQRRSRQLVEQRRQLMVLRGAMDRSALLGVTQRRERLKWLAGNLHSLDPKNLLAQGYSILFSEKDGSIINSTDDLARGAALRAMLSDGEALLRVERPRVTQPHQDEAARDS